MYNDFQYDFKLIIMVHFIVELFNYFQIVSSVIWDFLIIN